ncbi:hypothetical protein Misp02_67240 [Microtetraspora sp. NBRC 16547]|nr:hypothetical protein Misp02_67240 [Microtetraspora sp. NBRC 16547]
MLSMTSTASAKGIGWRDVQLYGSVKVSSDRKHIKVCDRLDDGIEVWAEYKTSYLLTHTVRDEKGGDGACAKDSVFWGHITVFKLCAGYSGPNQCNRDIQISPTLSW